MDKYRISKDEEDDIMKEISNIAVKAVKIAVSLYTYNKFIEELAGESVNKPDKKKKRGKRNGGGGK